MPATDEVLGEKLGHDGLDIGHVDLVDETVDALAQRCPRHALVLWAALVRHLLLQHAQARRGHVHPACIASFEHGCDAISTRAGFGLGGVYLLLGLTTLPGLAARITLERRGGRAGHVWGQDGELKQMLHARLS